MDQTIDRKFTEFYHISPEAHFSAPGRTEIGGNHTDHQHGRVLAAAVDLEARAAVAGNGDGIIRFRSEGYDYFEVDLRHLAPVPEERGKTVSLVRGIAARMMALGHELRGFDACIASTVLPGSGLSSSAAVEVLIGTILNERNGCGLTPLEIAQIGQYAENVYFGKPSGLMDQTASAVGGMIAIDFKNPEGPVVRELRADFDDFGHALCIIESGADHAGLTAEYASIPFELKTLCRAFGREYLRELPEAEFYHDIRRAREAAGDRAVLRAMHVYEENKRVDGEVNALENGDFDSFLKLVRESGLSSWVLLQNITPSGSTEHQALAFALALCERLLDGRGACRVHGGGFAGTIQAFVPIEQLPVFRAEIESVLGEGTCHVLRIRQSGGIRED